MFIDLSYVFIIFFVYDIIFYYNYDDIIYEKVFSFGFGKLKVRWWVNFNYINGNYIIKDGEVNRIDGI